MHLRDIADTRNLKEKYTLGRESVNCYRILKVNAALKSNHIANDLRIPQAASPHV
jgi:hypothetical protein